MPEGKSEAFPMLCGLKRIRFTGAGRSIPACYFEITKGSPEQAADYCKKDGGFRGVWKITADDVFPLLEQM
ncbi:hypothetical protein CEXT_2071 [Caerostris extrusa]|uniref:Uncharacterized protein n=1 Tax=Caerostris extrusa TaxID=172846 RepID=A0AAV4XIR3_CAEEX|nr:hypothetical protein CEXT_2071 [Caerostris extrusa]